MPNPFSGDNLDMFVVILAVAAQRIRQVVSLRFSLILAVLHFLIVVLDFLFQGVSLGCQVCELSLTVVNLSSYLVKLNKRFLSRLIRLQCDCFDLLSGKLEIEFKLLSLFLRFSLHPLDQLSLQIFSLFSSLDFRLLLRSFKLSSQCPERLFALLDLAERARFFLVQSEHSALDLAFFFLKPLQLFGLHGNGLLASFNLSFQLFQSLK